jgi:integrase
LAAAKSAASSKVLTSRLACNSARRGGCGRGAGVLGAGAGGFRLELAEGYVDRDPTAALFTPKRGSPAPSHPWINRRWNSTSNALELRERAIALLAIFAGMHRGEILALKSRHVSGDCRKARIEQRIYRGDIDTPKTHKAAPTPFRPRRLLP